ncbi:MAG TPA: transglutaminase-like domain-containing protein [Actinomycetota bacterium]|nr:transglutaminase-like domain-containing protein [Actinomycetota bacterium]
MRDAVGEFADVVSRPEEQIDLARAALLLSAADHPDIEMESYLARIDEMAYGVADLESLLLRLFTEVGFDGEREHYYEPESSFLDLVIDRRRGNPITLSVLTIEVGRRAGIKLEGIGMPGHFLVRSPMTGEYVDPFFKGELMDEEAVEARFRQVTGLATQVRFGPGMRPVSSKLEILARMLNNLKAIYRARSDGRSLEWVLRMRLAIPIIPRDEVTDLGQALALQGRVHEAAAEVLAMADAHPELADQLRAAARSLRASLN